MPRYHVTLTDDEVQNLKDLIQKGGKGYRIKHAQILLKLDHKPENIDWTYDRIKAAYNASHGTIAGIAKRFVMDGMQAALGRKKMENHYRKVTGDIVNILVRWNRCSGGTETGCPEHGNHHYEFTRL
jgi:hypothetical protein